jgi:hypothetical protein
MRKDRVRAFRSSRVQSRPSTRSRLIEALTETVLRHIQACSFVNIRLVPGWADAEAVVPGN